MWYRLLSLLAMHTANHSLRLQAATTEDWLAFLVLCRRYDIISRLIVIAQRGETVSSLQGREMLIRTPRHTVLYIPYNSVSKTQRLPVSSYIPSQPFDVAEIQSSNRKHRNV